MRTLFLILFLLFYSVGLPPGVLSVLCYCTDDHCPSPYGTCEGDVCLVGILADNNDVIRTCGNRPLGCFRSGDPRWADLCACDQPLCNTFAFLRANARNRPSYQDEEPQAAEQSAEEQSGQNQVVFHRMDRPDDQPINYADSPTHNNNKRSLVSVLLVVIPLSVGAATIAVVAFNSYCHLC